MIGHARDKDRNTQCWPLASLHISFVLDGNLVKAWHETLLYGRRELSKDFTSTSQ